MIYYTVLIVFVLDRLAKLLVMINVNPGTSVRAFSFLNISHIYNTGAAFSLFRGRNDLLIFINGAIIAALLASAIFSRLKNRLVILAYGLITGGALSNFADRIFYGGVVDYLDFKIWPVFNLADAAITAGAALILVDIINGYRIKKRGIKNAS